MIKKILIIAALAAVTGVLVFGAINRTQAKTTADGVNPGSGGGYGRSRSLTEASYETGGSLAIENGGGRGRQGNSQGGYSLTGILPAASGELSQEESDALTYMREEEKLAHDVYIALYSQWGLPVFQNISASEQTHTDAVKTLLDRYGLADPASNQPGVFTNPDLQSLYNELVAQGSQSLAEALKVGAAIEEIDILDLEQRLAATDNADIQQVFTNLMSGSYNHLRSFVSVLKSNTGEDYQPQYLTPEAYQTIINSSPARGGGNGRGGGQGGGGRWNQTNTTSS